MNFNINAAFGEGESITIGDKTFTFGGENGITGDNAIDQAKNLVGAINEAGIGDIQAEAEGKMVKLTSVSGYSFITPTVSGKMEANQAIVADTQVAGHILKHTFTVHNEDSAGAANFKAGDTFTVLDGNTYTFGSGEGQVVVGKDLWLT